MYIIKNVFLLLHEGRPQLLEKLPQLELQMCNVSDYDTSTMLTHKCVSYVMRQPVWRRGRIPPP
jgi:hypothetical protein